MIKNAFIFTLFILLLSPTYNLPPCFARNNASSHLEYLDNPYLNHFPGKQLVYARNIWDMIGFQGKLYLGAGNSSNYGPAPNAGPVPIIAYTPESNSFEPVFKVTDEQIDSFYVFNNHLLVPGHDPKENWEFGNLYLSDNGQQWQKKRTIPHAIHTYCLCLFDNKIFAGLGTTKHPSIAVSEDFGTSWNVSLTNLPGRIYNFIVVANKLYAAGQLVSPEFLVKFQKILAKQHVGMYEYTKNKFVPRQDISTKLLFPDTNINSKKRCKISKSQNLKNKAIYIGSYLHNDHQSLPFGLYVAESLSKNSLSIKKVPLPEDALPWDIYRSMAEVYVLLNKPLVNDTMEISVLQSNDLVNWTELFYFSFPTLVRSFALLGDNFYFSIGSEINNPIDWHQNELEPETGSISKFNARYILQDHHLKTIE